MSCVQSFEDEHEAFAASRVSQYCFVPAKESYFAALDQHADTLDGDVKLPLVLLGNEGSGKSAFLANWVAKRREHRHRDEFLFQHFVGCSTPSLQLAHTLFRLETALKDFFQLREMKVPDTEVELRWSLNRFLDAAQKKHFPARIVIIIDGINRLKSEGAPDGSLHWLPTELPPCVRFILSSVEFERVPRGSREVPPHRTFVELSRRNCSFLRMEPLGVETRHRVISTFTTLHDGSVEMTENQLYKIVTSNATSQPMFLRALLQALRITSRLTNFSVDQLLDMLLSCQSAVDLVDKNLNLCCEAIFGEPQDNQGDNNQREILGKIFSVVYVSRNGLTRDEIWGLIKMVTQQQLTESVENKIMSVLAEFTMVVNNMHSFSHEVYRELVYDKYIRSHEALTRWHHLMARYFGQLPPCARKLVALPYHLEVAGQWTRVKNCLTEIEMFQLWWTPPFKGDFVKFWVSLTKQVPTNVENNRSKTKKKGTTKRIENSAASAAFDAEGNHSIANRPSYDIVEEYVKSLDEYRAAKNPTDEAVASIILEIADFLLEFATLGHEKAADVPQLIHPKILSKDLKSIGVPYIEIDEFGRSGLVYPAIFNLSTADDGTGFASDAPTKALDDIPVCTTYFFNRWMWIQFPYIALGNCNSQFEMGIKKLKESTTYAANENIRTEFLKAIERHQHMSKYQPGDTIRRKIVGSMSVTSLDDFKRSKDTRLPELKFSKRAARTLRKLTAFDKQDESKVNADKFTQRIVALQDDIHNHREMYDFVCLQKSGMNKRLYELKGELEQLKRSEESVEIFNKTLSEASKREAEAAGKAASGQTQLENLKFLYTMCERHPANVPPLILEIEHKIEQDKFLIAEIKNRLWGQRFEDQAHKVKYREMKQLARDGMEMHNKLLEYRYSMKRSLAAQALDDQMRATSGKKGSTSDKYPRRGDRLLRRGGEKDSGEGEDRLTVHQEKNWEDIWSLISARTGIIEPEIFFSRFNNRKIHEEQINVLVRASDTTKEVLKKEESSLEQELDEVLLAASFPDGQSKNESEKEVTKHQRELRHVKERSVAAQQLVQNVQSGLLHIAELLGLGAREEDAPVSDLLRDIEAVLDTLIDERDKQQQQQQQQMHGHSQSQSDTNSRGHNSIIRGEIVPNPEAHLHRSPELEAVLAKYEIPKARLPHILPSRPTESIAESSRDNEDDVDEEGGMWDRSFVKTQSMRNVRTELKRAARQSKLATDELHLASTM